MKQAFLVVILMGFSISLMAQEDSIVSASNRDTPSPDFSGAIVVDYGVNFFDQHSEIMNNEMFKSPTINVYYMYPFKIKSTRFSFNVGGGIGTEKYTFTSPVTFVDSVNVTLVDTIANLSYFENIGAVNKSQMVTNYFDIPFEFRVHSRKNDHKRSFYLALGAKVGFRFANKTKVVYSEFEQDKTFKSLYHYNVNAVRYGASARLGIGPFTIWGYYGLNKYFAVNKISGFNNPNTYSFGISLAAF